MKPHKLIYNRWSPVAFDPKPVEHEKILALFEAARWAPSSRNAQPWRFIYGTSGLPAYDVLFDLLNEGNKIWARTAPLLVLGLSEVISAYKDRPNRFAFYDTGMAVTNLLIQATNMDLFVHQMGGYDMEKARQVLGFPSRFEPASMMAIGYKGDPAQLPEDVVSRELQKRERKDLKEILIAGKWAQD